MPIRQLDRAALKCEAKDLIRTARVSPIKMTLLLLAISLVLDLLDTALTYLTGSIVGVAFLSISFVGILITLISQVLSAGYCCYCLGVHRREEMPYESLFDGFTFAGKVIALILDSFPAIMLGSLLGRLASMLAQIYFLPYYTLSECGFYLRATAPEEPPRQDRSSYTPEF